MRTVPRLQKPDDNIFNRHSDAVREAIGELQGLAVLNGQFVTVALASGSNRVAHGLGRQPVGWMVVDTDAAVTVYRTAWSATTLDLTASGAVTVKLWVF